MAAGVGVLRQMCVGTICVVAPHPKNHYRPYLLRHPVLGFTSALLVATKVGTALLLSLTPEVASLSTISAAFLVAQTNAARKEAGLLPLEEHPLLTKSARLKAEDMLQHDYFEHTSPQGVSPWKWFDDAGYNYINAGENLAIDFTTGEAVHAAWLKSPGHRKNIVSQNYRHIGIAVATGEFQGRTTTVIAQHFGSLSGAPAAPRPAAPSPTPAPPERPRATPTPLPTPPPPPTIVPPPTILEPSEGQLLPSGAATVRGLSTVGSTVGIALDGHTVGAYLASSGTFQGAFNPPQEEEREASLTATASLRGKTSAPSTPRRVVLDTRGPTIAESSALLLPDPRGSPGTLILVVPVTGDPARVTARVGTFDRPLTLRGSVASATIEAREATQPLVVRAEDRHGNAREVSIRPFERFRITPRTQSEEDARARVLGVTENLRTASTVILTIVALLLAINIFVFIRIQHADLIAHALFVIVLSSMLVVIT